MGAYADHLKDGRMAYAQRGDLVKPWWYRLGMKIGEITDSDSTDDACTKAGIAFAVGKRPVYVKNDKGEYVELTDFVATARDDELANPNKAVLGIVSPDWRGPSPRQLVGVLQDGMNANNIKLATLMGMKGGRMIAGSARLDPKYSTKIGSDLIYPIFTFCTNNAGQGSTRYGITDVTAVCENTTEGPLAAADGRGMLIRIGHRTDFVGGDIARVLEANEGTLTERIAFYNRLVDKKMSDQEVAEFFARDVLSINPDELTKNNADGSPVIKTRTRNMLTALMTAYKHGAGADARIGSAWAAYQAVTYWTDHEASTRDTCGDGEALSRIYSSQYGKGAQVKAKALAALTKVAA